MASAQERLARLLEEEKSLEAQGNGAEEENFVSGDNEVSIPDESLDSLVENTELEPTERIAHEDTTEKPSGSVEELRTKLADAEHRFNRYKGSADRTIYNLRQQVIELNESIVLRDKEIGRLAEELKNNSPKQELFSEEDRAYLGEDTAANLENILNGYKSKIDMLETELKDAKKSQPAKVANDLKAQAEIEFMDNLRGLVPDMDKMNRDPGFNKWLRESGPDGVIRIERLHYDQSVGDYHRVAEFFNAYKSISEKDTKKIVKDSIDSYISPKNANTSDSVNSHDDSKKGWVKQSEINQYNRDISKGKYRFQTEKADAMEMRFFKASQEGKILMDERPIH